MSLTLPRALLISVTLHFAILATLFVTESSQRPLPSESKNPINVRFVPKAFPKTVKEHKEPLVAKAYPKQKQVSKKGTREKHTFSQKELISVPKTSVYSLMPKVSDWSRYQIPESSNQTAQSNHTSSLAIAKTEQDSLLGIFSSYVEERIAVPEELTKLFVKSEGELKICQRNELWKIREISGEPYFNAILYDAVETSLEFSAIQDSLKHSKFPCIQIGLEFKILSSLNAKLPELKTHISSNRIQYEHTVYYVAKEWSPFSAFSSGNGVGFAFNFLAAGMYVADKLQDPQTRDDLEKNLSLHNLRSSKGFLNFKLLEK